MRATCVASSAPCMTCGVECDWQTHSGDRQPIASQRSPDRDNARLPKTNRLAKRMKCLTLAASTDFQSVHQGGSVERRVDLGCRRCGETRPGGYQTSCPQLQCCSRDPLRPSVDKHRHAICNTRLRQDTLNADQKDRSPPIKRSLSHPVKGRPSNSGMPLNQGRPIPTKGDRPMVGCRSTRADPFLQRATVQWWDAAQPGPTHSYKAW